MSRKRKSKKTETGLGGRLKKLRDQKKKTQEDIARDLKLAAGTFSRWEREASSPQAEQLLQLAEYFEVTLDHLLLGEVHEAPVHSAEFHRFLATSPGRWAQEHNLVKTLASIESEKPLTAEMYRAIVNVFRDAWEAEQDEAESRNRNTKRDDP